MFGTCVLFSIPDRNILEGESAKANGGHRSLSTKWAALTEEIITMLEKRVQVVKPPEPAFFSTWDRIIFTRVCAIVVLIDPLFLYLNIVNDNMKCLDWDHNFTTTYMVLRSTTDLFYVINLVFYIWRNSKKLIAWRRKSDQTACAGGGRKDNRRFPVNFFLLFVVALPIPQVRPRNQASSISFFMLLLLMDPGVVFVVDLDHCKMDAGNEILWSAAPY